MPACMCCAKAGLAVARQRAVTVMYDGVIVGDDTVDLLVQGSVTS